MLAKIIKTILRYPVGAKVGFFDEFTTEYDTVSGYLYTKDAFYVLFSSNHTINMKRLDALIVSTQKGGHE